MSVSPGRIGEIIVSGPAVTASYHARDEATRLAKIADANVPSGFWHRMGDLGYFDEQGRLWFCGRKSQRVTTADGDRYTIPCEGIFNAHPDVRRTALVGVPVNNAITASDGANHQARGRAVMKPVLCVELREEVRRPPDTIREELLRLGEKHAQTRGIRDILFHPAFPVDIRHNAKIGREELGRWAARKLREH